MTHSISLSLNENNLNHTQFGIVRKQRDHGLEMCSILLCWFTPAPLVCHRSSRNPAREGEKQNCGMKRHQEAKRVSRVGKDIAHDWKRSSQSDLRDSTGRLSRANCLIGRTDPCERANFQISAQSSLRGWQYEKRSQSLQKTPRHLA